MFQKNFPAYSFVEIKQQFHPKSLAKWSYLMPKSGIFVERIQYFYGNYFCVKIAKHMCIHKNFL